jgi:hypothetical protein
MLPWIRGRVSSGQELYGSNERVSGWRVWGLILGALWSHGSVLFPHHATAWMRSPRPPRDHRGRRWKNDTESQYLCQEHELSICMIDIPLLSGCKWILQSLNQIAPMPKRVVGVWGRKEVVTQYCAVGRQSRPSCQKHWGKRQYFHLRSH